MIISRRHSNWIVFVAALIIAGSWSEHGRANAPPGRYDITNDTVYDKQTELRWLRTINGNMYTWSDAQMYCTNLNLDGIMWRLPSMKELQTIVDETRVSPAIDQMVFPATAPAAFWTSSMTADSQSDAWYVNFADGAATQNASQANTYRVRCVH